VIRIDWLPSYEYQRQRWKNGLGWTREILREPAHGDDYALRLSIAEIDRDCAFSAFPGMRRCLVLLEGAGMRLQFDDGEERLVAPPHGRIDFSGDRALHCQLIDGPTRDFNLMWQPSQVAAELHHRPLVGSMVFFAQPGTRWYAYVLAGWAVAKDRPGAPRAEAGDTLVLHTDSGSGRLLLDGAGELLLVRRTALPASPSPPTGAP
jgi:uncharacterized protein